MSTTSNRTTRRRWQRSFAALAALALTAAACGSDEEAVDEPATTEAAVDEEATEEAPAEEAPAEEAPAEEAMDDEVGGASSLDANGDGEVRIGIAAQGPRDDGGYYQGLVDQAEQISAANGFGDVIVVDEISFEEAATELDNLANQPVDIILVGASGLAGNLAEVAEQYPDIYWYCNCGAGFAESPFFSQTQDEGAGIHYTAGVAFGELLAANDGDSLAILGCCDLAFEKEVVLAVELGMQAVDPSFSVIYTPTGDFPFDFDNVANATAAFDAAVAGGADAIYPFLGGALEPIAQLAIDEGLLVANPGSASACDGDLAYDIAVRFDAGDYVGVVFPQIVSGEFAEGSVRVFNAADDPDVVGATFCDAADLQPALDEAYATVASGDLDEAIGQIKAEAFAEG
jgi:basic membrane lipoprotein Med (substrate-binding protein (PBP1-ABC) superfamily)